MASPSHGGPLSVQVLETCVNHCGEKFHNEVAKFRFLNELIKVLSPKVSAQGLALSVPLTVGVTKTLQVKSSVLPRLRPLQTPIMSLGDPQATCTSARPATSSEVPLTPSARLPNSLDRKIHRTQKSTILNNILLF